MTGESIYTSDYKSPFGDLILGSINNTLCLCDWKYRKQRDSIDKRLTMHFNTDFKEKKTEVNEITITQLEEYFSGTRETFDIPLTLAGTSFQESVWNKLIQIPYGQTQSYLELSKNLGNEKAIRAVATANGANAISIIIPCHRIIGSKGDLVGYAGGLEAKKKLLALEGAINKDQLELF